MANRIYTQDDYDKITAIDQAYQSKRDSYTPEQQKKIEKRISDAYTTVSNGIEESKNKVIDSYIDEKGNAVSVYGDGRTEILRKNDQDVAKEVIQGKWGNGATRKNNLEQAGYDYNTIQNIVNSRVKSAGGQKPNPNPNPEDTKQEPPIVVPEVKQDNTVPPKNTVPPQKDTIVEFPEQNPENNSYLALDETIKNLETDAERISYLEKLGYKPNSKGYYEKGGIKTRVYKDGQYNPTEVRSDNGQYITTPPRNDEVDIALQEQGYNGQRDKDGHFIPKGDGSATITSNNNNNNNNRKVNTYNPVGDILNGINSLKTNVPAFVNSIPVRAEGTVQTIKGVNQALEGYNKMTNNSLSTNAIKNALNNGRIVNNRNELSNETLRILLNQGFTIGTDGTIYRPDGKRFLKLQYPVSL